MGAGWRSGCDTGPGYWLPVVRERRRTAVTRSGSGGPGVTGFPNPSTSWRSLRACPSRETYPTRTPSYSWSSLIQLAGSVSGSNRCPSPSTIAPTTSRNTTAGRSTDGSPRPNRSGSRVGRCDWPAHSRNGIAPSSASSSACPVRVSRYSNCSMAYQVRTSWKSSCCFRARSVSRPRRRRPCSLSGPCTCQGLQVRLHAVRRPPGRGRPVQLVDRRPPPPEAVTEDLPDDLTL